MEEVTEMPALTILRSEIVCAVEDEELLGRHHPVAMDLL